MKAILKSKLNIYINLSNLPIDVFFLLAFTLLIPSDWGVELKFHPFCWIFYVNQKIILFQKGLSLSEMRKVGEPCVLPYYCIHDVCVCGPIKTKSVMLLMWYMYLLVNVLVF